MTVWMLICLLFTLVGAAVVGWFLREFYNKDEETALVRIARDG